MTTPLPPALFERDGTTLLPTALGRGPWDHGFLHGGAVCGALGWAIEQARGRDDLLLVRATVEIHSMVPLAPLHTAGAIIKPGRRTQVVEATLATERGVVARATSQWVAHRPGAVPPTDPAVPARPDRAVEPAADAGFDYPRPGFNCDAVELRPLVGTTETPGPGSTWVRLRTPVVAGEPTSALLAVLTLSDVGIAVGWEPSPTGAAFINTDVTLQVNRPPVGPWVLMDSRVHASTAGAGFCETVLGDDAGPFGRVLQSLVEAPAALAAALPAVAGPPAG